jgi:hypothetical protein
VVMVQVRSTNPDVRKSGNYRGGHPNRRIKAHSAALYYYIPNGGRQCYVVQCLRRLGGGCGRVTSSVTLLFHSSTTMSLEAARNLSVRDLLSVLNEKLNLECTRIRVPPLVSAASPESEVRTTIDLSRCDDGPYHNESHRSRVSKPWHAIF